MKKNLHPPYQEVLFIDSSTGDEFICGSTLQPKEKKEYKGKEYPVFRVSVSSFSHPFFTKSKQFIDTEKRIDQFTKRYAKKKEQNLKETEKQEEKLAKAKKAKVAAKTPVKAQAKTPVKKTKIIKEEA